MGLVELGQHTGLSPALLSKIERGRLFPTLPTLLRIALVFSVGLEFFFAGARDKPLVAMVRKTSACVFPIVRARTGRPTGSSRSTIPAPNGVSIRTTRIFSRARAALQTHGHAGGRIHLHAGRDARRPYRGRRARARSRRLDVFRFERPHAYRRSGGRTCSAIVVTSL